MPIRTCMRPPLVPKVSSSLLTRGSPGAAPSSAPPFPAPQLIPPHRCSPLRFRRHTPARHRRATPHERRGTVDRSSAIQPQRAPRYRAHPPRLLTHGCLHTRSDRPREEHALIMLRRGPRRRARVARSKFVVLSHPIGKAPSHPLEKRHAGSEAQPRQHEPTHAPPGSGQLVVS